MRTLDERVKLTLDYMNSPEGIRNWFENQRRGYDRRKNVLAAIQTATRLIAWERIAEVDKSVETTLFNVYDRVEAELTARKEEMAG
jgi:hypothetical protein